jgi:hypothetical protein
MSLVQVIKDVWLCADMVQSVEIEAVHSERVYRVLVWSDLCGEPTHTKCGEYADVEAARAAAATLAQAVNDALREIA